MKLVIVESPAKAKTIEKYLGKDYKVLASVGHVRDLPKSDKDAIDIDDGFRPNYVVIKEKEKVLKNLGEEVKKVDSVLLATDPDREGEAIAWHLQEALDLPLQRTKRIVFNEITEDAITKAIKNPRDIDTNLKVAQEARRVLDRLFGYTLSKLIWTKVRYGLSAGRVQSPALRILMQREREIQAFVPKPYWDLTATVRQKNNKECIASCEKEQWDKDVVEKIKKEGSDKDWEVANIKETLQKRSPKAPFTTSTLQQAANSYLGLSPSSTMYLAQKLYEGGYITYMRTDSTNLSETAHEQIKNFVSKEYGAKYYNKTIYAKKSKNAQEAHEAIRPTDAERLMIPVSKEERALYVLIQKRTVASQMIPAEMQRTVVYFEYKDLPKFAIRGVRVVEEGWQKADKEALTEEVTVPSFEKGESVKFTEIFSKEKETTPPNRYSEAGLVKELEARGIGRPSTYASTIRTLIERQYVEKEQRSLIPTDLGNVVSTFIEKHFEKYIADDFTATMENNLDEIASGTLKYDTTIGNFFFPFRDAVEAKKDIEKLTSFGKVDESIKCPKCNSNMVFKLARTGTFMSCENFPECTGGRTKEGEIIKDPESIGKTCPKCEKGDLVRRTGRFGDFISCANYPKCKYIEEDEAERTKKDTGVKCGKCKKGTFLERKGKFGTFYGCSEYPTCSSTLRAKPTGNNCSECGGVMMEGTKTIPERCGDKACPMHNPHKL